MSSTANDNGLVARLSPWFRERRARHLKELLVRAKTPGQPLRVIDLGGRYEFWRRVGTDFLDEHGIQVTVLNLTENEAGEPPNPHPAIACAVGDACSLEFADGAFDVVVSNSVIEHVGSWQNMIDFANNVRRLGKTYYCQTPNFWFPIDPHFWKLPLFHFLPPPTRAWLLRTFPLATAGRIPDVLASFHVVEGSRLLSRTQMAVLFPAATLRAERFLGVFVKSYTAIGTSSADRHTAGDR